MAVLAGTLAVSPGMLTVVAGALTVVAAMLIVALVTMGGYLWYFLELSEIFDTIMSLKTCKNRPKWPLNGTFHLKVTYVCTPGVLVVVVTAGCGGDARNQDVGCMR